MRAGTGIIRAGELSIAEGIKSYLQHQGNTLVFVGEALIVQGIPSKARVDNWIILMLFLRGPTKSKKPLFYVPLLALWLSIFPHPDLQNKSTLVTFYFFVFYVFWKLIICSVLLHCRILFFWKTNSSLFRHSFINGFPTFGLWTIQVYLEQGLLLNDVMNSC